MERRFRELSKLDHSGMQPDIGLQLAQNSNNLRQTYIHFHFAVSL